MLDPEGNSQRLKTSQLMYMYLSSLPWLVCRYAGVFQIMNICYPSHKYTPPAQKSKVKFNILALLLVVRFCTRFLTTDLDVVNKHKQYIDIVTESQQSL